MWLITQVMAVLLVEYASHFKVTFVYFTCREQRNEAGKFQLTVYLSG